MKIEGPGKATGPRGVSKSDAKRKTSDGAFGGLVDETPEQGAASVVGGPVSIGRLDALLSLQEAEGGTSEEAGKKAKKRAAALLDELDNIRVGLLMGGIPKSSLEHITYMVNAHRENIMDPALNEILDEIDLRAQVELAKHSK